MPMSCLGVLPAAPLCPAALPRILLLVPAGWHGMGKTGGAGCLPSTCPDLHALLAQEELMNNTELVQSYRQQISSVVNQFNLQLFLNMYNR